MIPSFLIYIVVIITFTIAIWIIIFRNKLISDNKDSFIKAIKLTFVYLISITLSTLNYISSNEILGFFFTENFPYYLGKVEAIPITILFTIWISSFLLCNYFVLVIKGFILGGYYEAFNKKLDTFGFFVFGSFTLFSAYNALFKVDYTMNSMIDVYVFFLVMWLLDKFIKFLR